MTHRELHQEMIRQQKENTWSQLNNIERKLELLITIVELMAGFMLALLANSLFKIF